MNKNNLIFSNSLNTTLFLLSLEGFLILLIFGKIDINSPVRTLTFLSFGIIMVLLFLSSAIYHSIPNHLPERKRFQKIDHILIYLMIAAGYSPVCLLVLDKEWGYPLLFFVWTITFLGIGQKIFKNGLPSWINVSIYLFTSWLLVISYPNLIKNLGLTGFITLIISGAFFTIGALVLIITSFEHRPLPLVAYNVFHIFIILGMASYLYLMISFI